MPRWLALLLGAVVCIVIALVLAPTSPRPVTPSSPSSPGSGRRCAPSWPWSRWCVAAPTSELPPSPSNPEGTSMPDTTPERPVIGVNVQHRDGSLHAIAAGRDWRFNEDALHVMNGTAPGSRVIAVFAPRAWDLVELVFAEPEPPKPSAPKVRLPDVQRDGITWRWDELEGGWVGKHDVP